MTILRRRAFRLTSLAYIIFGIALFILLERAPPFAIGEGRFEGAVHDVERYDFKWWIIGLLSAAWLVPIGGVVLVESARARGLDRERLKSVFREMLEHKSIPVIVDVDTRLPIALEGPLAVHVKLDANIDLDDQVEVDAAIPVSIDLPIDAEIATSVFGLGHIKVPIRATIPLNITIPLRTSIGIRAKRLPIHVEETAYVAMPSLEVPIKSRIETRVDLLSTLESEGVLKRG